MNMESLARSTGITSNVETLPSGSTTSTISKRMSKIYVLNSNRNTLVLKSEDTFSIKIQTSKLAWFY